MNQDRHESWMLRLADLPRVMVEKKQTGWLVFLVAMLAMIWYMDRHADAVSNFVLTSTGEIKTSLWVGLGTAIMFGLFVHDQRKATRQCEARVATLESHLFLIRTAFTRVVRLTGSHDEEVDQIIDRLASDMDSGIRFDHEPRKGGRRKADDRT